MMSSLSLEEAAGTLADHLFGFRRNYPEFHSYIGIGTDNLIVFAQGTKYDWESTYLEEWEGHEVVWHYGCGVTVAEPAR